MSEREGLCLPWIEAKSLGKWLAERAREALKAEYVDLAVLENIGSALAAGQTIRVEPRSDE